MLDLLVLLFVLFLSVIEAHQIHCQSLFPSLSFSTIDTPLQFKTPFLSIIDSLDGQMTLHLLCFPNLIPPVSQFPRCVTILQEITVYSVVHFNLAYHSFLFISLPFILRLLRGAFFDLHWI